MKNSLSKTLILIVVVFLVVVFTSMVRSHCQIPCGIYDDETRFTLMAEHITTIEKSMNQITSLSGQGKTDHNQIVRWVENKDKHADELSHIVTYYFLAQRIKPVDGSDAQGHQKYLQKLTLLHQILIHSMKAKQMTKLEHVEKLRGLLVQFKVVYFEHKGHKH